LETQRRAPVDEGKLRVFSASTCCGQAGVSDLYFSCFALLTYVCVFRDNWSLREQLQVLQAMGSGANRGCGTGSKYEEARRNSVQPFDSKCQMHESPPANSSPPIHAVTCVHAVTYVFCYPCPLATCLSAFCLLRALPHFEHAYQGFGKQKDRRAYLTQGLLFTVWCFI